MYGLYNYIHVVMFMSGQRDGTQAAYVYDDCVDILLLEIGRKLEIADFPSDGHGALPNMALTVGGPKISLSGEVVSASAEGHQVSLS